MSRRLFRLIPLFILALGLSLTSFFIVQHWEQRRTFAAFRGISSDHVHAISQHLDNLARQLTFVRALYNSSKEVGPEDYIGFSKEFRLFVREVILDDGQVKTAAFIHRVSGSERQTVVHTVRAAGMPYFDIFEIVPGAMPVISEEKEFYFPIIAAEPMPESSSILGIDLYSDARMKDSIEKAVKTGEVVSLPPRFDTEAESGSATMELLLAVGTSRNVQLEDGFILFDFWLGNLVEIALSGLNPAGIDFYFYDVSSDNQGTPLYVHASRTRSVDEVISDSDEVPFEWSTTLTVADRTIRVLARPTDTFIANHEYVVSWIVLGSSLLTSAVLLLSLVFNIRRSSRIEQTVSERTLQLSNEVSERRASEESLSNARQRVTEWASRLNQHNRRIELLGEMGDMLQSCQSLDEAYQVTSKYVARLFPGDSGVLYIYHESRLHLDLKVKWGLEPVGEELINPDECWALRRGKVHIGASRELMCKHVRDKAPENLIHICIPLIAQGETIGIFELSRTDSKLSAEEAAGENADNAFDESTRRLATATSEHMALAFANIRLRETLRQQSIRDPLTGLYNRRYMEEVVEREIHRAQRLDVELGIMIADIDHFKNFNDSYGHETGDLVLQHVGHYLSSAIRKEDIACRYGGEEFMLILPGASDQALLKKAEELRQGISEMNIKLDGGILPQITLSIGIARLDEQISDRDTLFRASDEALYSAKKNGRNRVEAFNLTGEV